MDENHIKLGTAKRIMDEYMNRVVNIRKERSTCEAPSTLQCFRRSSVEVIYVCEWTMNTTESDVSYDLYIEYEAQGILSALLGPVRTEIVKDCRRVKETTCSMHEDALITKRPVEIWVAAHVGNSSCTSPRRSVELQQKVKHDVPKDISMSWLKNNLSLSWTAVEEYPALAEVRFRRLEHPTDSWETRMTNTTHEPSKWSVIVVNLLKFTPYQVQIRQRSSHVRNPLWSDWSPVVTVPAELEQKPEVSMTTRLLNGTRKVTLTWKPMPHAAAVTGVMYKVMDTQSSQRCPCVVKRPDIKSSEYQTYVSYSAVNISVMAMNAAGSSPPAIIQVPAQPAADLKICNETLMNKKIKKKTCREFYELRDGDSRPENIITVTADKRRNMKDIQEFVCYLYFEHRCKRGKPHTIEMCLFYKKQGAPRIKPQNFTHSSETDNSVNLSWKAIPPADQRGFLTHYSLCSVKISSPEVRKECLNISASVINYRLENLTPGAQYNISLAGVTPGGEGPNAQTTVNTLPEKPVNVLWSLSLLFVFFFISTTCTCILKRIKNKIFPPVPTPVIPNFTPYQAESQEMLERKEEVHELTLLQLHPEVKSVHEDEEESTILRRDWDDDADKDVESERGDSSLSGGTSDECLGPGSTDQVLRRSKEGEATDLEQLDNEIAMLIYRNGLVFDVKTESP
ncbi:interleukin-6 receptor subunit beta-like isoform X3 [Sparus aurata]|uniref:interleukin-6 receptor subunit beta-like isoform X3 n=1 Tax=Sparus aurata TaxID=8175 RepID=UPI0011C15510|nr:interleukin-6 receptor subunit beta-like isoform X3 [Sparus aurata]